MRLTELIEGATSISVRDATDFLRFPYRDRPLYKVTDTPSVDHLVDTKGFRYINSFSGLHFFWCVTRDTDFIVGARITDASRLSSDNVLIYYSVTYISRAEFPTFDLKSRIPVARLIFVDKQLRRHWYTNHVLDSLISKFGTLCSSQSYSIEDWISYKRFLHTHENLKFFILDNYRRTTEISDPENVSDYIYSSRDRRLEFYQKNVVLLDSNFNSHWI